MTERRNLELSQDTWGWDRTGSYWVPPEYAGVYPDINILDEYEPNPVSLGPLLSLARGVNMCASRRGSKTHTGGRVVPMRIGRDVERVLSDRDVHTSRERFNRWFLQTVGSREQSRPNELFSEVLKKRHAPLTYWAIGPDRELSKLQARELSAVFDRDYVRDVLGVKWFGDTLWILAWGCRIDLKTGERPDKLVGDSLSGVWLGEAARLKPEVWENVAPALDDRRGWIVTDTTPRGRNWYYTTLWAKGDRVVAEELGNPELFDEEWENFHWTAADNFALPHLADEMEKAKRVYGEKSRHYIENYAASFATPEGMVWPQLDRQVHVRRLSEDYFEQRVGAIDWGYSASAGALGFAGIMTDGRWHWYGGHYHRGLVVAPGNEEDRETANNWANLILEEYSRVGEDFIVYADPSQPGTIALLKRMGIRIMKAQLGKGSILDSCVSVESMLVFDPEARDPASRVPMMTFSPDLPPEILSDVWGYEWATDAQGSPLPTPSKKPDRHGADVIRYAVHTRRRQLRLPSALARQSLTGR